MNHQRAYILLLLLALLATACAARICAPGTFEKRGRCKKCRQGTYQDQPGTTSCNNCPKGTLTRVSGVPSKLLCRPCPDDSTTARPGATRCRKCPPGHIRQCGECKRCPPGSSFEFGCACEKCAPDAFSTKPNQLECTNCPPGFRATEDRKSCEDARCPPGTEFDGDECIECMYRNFRDGSTPKCQPCPPRTTILDFSKPHAKCDKCPPGMFLTDLFVITDEQLPVCENCPPGSSTKGFSKAFCRRDGNPCPEGTFEDAEGDCDVCYEGYRYDAPKNKCVKCGPDEKSFGGLVTKCDKCLPGQFGKGVYCDCPVGNELRAGKCRPCPPGSYRDESQGACIECASDEFSARGSTKCNKCPKGSLSVESGGRKCKPLRCEKGFIRPPPFTSYFPDNVCISVRTGCPKGLFFISDKYSMFLCGDKNGNVVCPKGRVFDNDGSCLRCLPGSRAEEKQDGTLLCEECPPSKPVSPGGSSRECRKCKKGFEPSLDYAKCICPFGKFVTKNRKCRPCPTPSDGKKLPKGCPRK